MNDKDKMTIALIARPNQPRWGSWSKARVKMMM